MDIYQIRLIYNKDNMEVYSKHKCFAKYFPVVMVFMNLKWNKLSKHNMTLTKRDESHVYETDNLNHHMW